MLGFGSRKLRSGVITGDSRSSRQGRGGVRGRWAHRPCLEGLEVRLTPSTGAGSGAIAASGWDLIGAFANLAGGSNESGSRSASGITDPGGSSLGPVVEGVATLTIQV